MNKFIILLFLIFGLFVCLTFGQDSVKVIKNSSQPCLLTKAGLPVVGNLKLGSSLSELKKEYPELLVTNTSLFPNTTAYLTVSPFSGISHLLLVFSTEDKLISYTLVYPSQQWTSIELPFKQAMESLKLAVSRNSWTIWRENEKETITVTCKDFALISTLSPLRNEQTNDAKSKRFLFSVSDNSIAAGFTENNQSNNQRRQNTQTNKTDSYIFPQSNSEFTVEFPQEPIIKRVRTDFGDADEATVTTDDSVLRAEYAILTAEQIATINNATEDQLTQIYLAVGKMFGYSGVTATISNTNLGKLIKLRGYKVIDGISLMIEHFMYFGKKSAITLVTAGKADNYPTASVYKFLNSLKRKLQ